MNRELENKTKTIKDFLVLGMGTFVNMLVGVMLTPIITHLVDPEHYGNSSLFIMYAEIAMVIIGLGLDQTLVRYYYKENQNLYHQRLLYQCWKAPILICGSLIAAFFVVRVLLSNFLPEVYEIVLFRQNLDIREIIMSSVPVLFLFCTLFLLIHRYAMLIIRLQRRTCLYSVMNIMQKVLYGGMALLLIVYVNVGKDFENLMIATTISYFVVALIGLLSARNVWSLKGIKNYMLPFPSSALYKYGIPLIFSSCVVRMLQACGSTMLKVLSDDKTVGIYASAINLVHIFAIIQTTFNTIWAPMMVEHYEKNKEDKQFYIKANQIITFILFFFGATMLLCKDVFVIILGKEYREAAYALPFLMFFPIMYTISETTNCGIVFMNKSRMNIWVSLIALISDFVMCLLLIPSFGAIGAAMATAVGYTVFFIARTVIGNQYYYIDFKLSKTVLTTILFVMFCLYSSFHSFDTIILISYCMFCLVVSILYKDVIFDALGLLKAFIKGKSNRTGGE